MSVLPVQQCTCHCFPRCDSLGVKPRQCLLCLNLTDSETWHVSFWNTEPQTPPGRRQRRDICYSPYIVILIIWNHFKTNLPFTWPPKKLNIVRKMHKQTYKKKVRLTQRTVFGDLSSSAAGSRSFIMFVWIVCVTQLFVPVRTVVHGVLHKRGIQVHSSNNNWCPAAS